MKAIILTVLVSFTALCANAADLSELKQTMKMNAAISSRAQAKAAADSKAKHTGKVAGRLLEDAFLKYSYAGSKPGSVKLTNRAGGKASYDYSASTGIFKIREFSGKNLCENPTKNNCIMNRIPDINKNKNIIILICLII